MVALVVSAPRKVLLVDDSALVRAVVVHALSASGLDVTTIDDPRAIDGAISKDRPDLLLVDATFPGVTDEDLVAAVSRHAAAIPVVLFSDRPEGEVRALVSKSGASGFVPKDGATLAERLKPFLAS
jgi:DNA-binding response OmpR family regulator